MDKRIMKRRLFGVIDEAELFQAEIEANGYFDEDDVLEFLRWLQVELHAIIDVRQRGIT